MRAKPDGHSVPSIPGDDKTKVGHLRFLGDVGISPQLPRSDPTVAGRSFCDEDEVSPDMPRYVISCSILLSYHLSPLPQLDTLLVRPTANLDSYSLGASHPACTAWHRAEQKVAATFQQGFVSPDDHGKCVRPTHLSTSKDIFAVAVEVKHLLVKALVMALSPR